VQVHQRFESLDLVDDVGAVRRRNKICRGTGALVSEAREAKWRSTRRRGPERADDRRSAVVRNLVDVGPVGLEVVDPRVLRDHLGLRKRARPGVVIDEHPRLDRHRRAVPVLRRAYPDARVRYATVGDPRDRHLARGVRPELQVKLLGRRHRRPGAPRPPAGAERKRQTAAGGPLQEATPGERSVARSGLPALH
jgi:hypothetical protein